MTQYYISPSGNDATGDGLSPATAWQSWNKAVGSSAAITLSGSGDTLNVAPGIYREVVTFALTPSSSSPFTIKGDPTGAVFGVSPGLPELRGWTTDTSIITGTGFKGLGVSYLTMQNVAVTGGTTGAVGFLSDSTHLTIEDCIFVNSQNSAYALFYGMSTTDTPMNSTIRRCTCVSTYYDAAGINPSLGSAEYDAGLLVENCQFFSRRNGISFIAGGAGTFMPKGVSVVASGFYWNNTSIAFFAATAINNTVPNTAYGNKFFGSTTGINANNTTQIIEDYNTFSCTTPRSNVNIGANSQSSPCPALNFGIERLTGEAPRPFGEPLATSPYLAFGNYTGVPTVDLYSQSRPATASSGALERDTFNTGGSTYIFQTQG